MPVKPLPKSLIRRLRRAAPAIDKMLGRMKNIDYEADFLARYGRSPTDTGSVGGRVRQMNVKRNFPKVEVVIKRTHLGDFSAQRLIEIVRSTVRTHNQRARPRLYTLVAPTAYAISLHLIAMAKTEAPTVRDIIRRTPRGMVFFERLAKKYPRAQLPEISDVIEAHQELLSNKPQSSSPFSE